MGTPRHGLTTRGKGHMDATRGSKLCGSKKNFLDAVCSCGRMINFVSVRWTSGSNTFRTHALSQKRKSKAARLCRILFNLFGDEFVYA